MSEVLIGEFSIDPETIPEQDKLSENIDLTLEVVKAERKEKIDEEGRKSVRISLQVACTDVANSPLAFATLWITEKFKGAAHRSFATFLKTLDLPYTTTVDSLKGTRFTGQVRANKQNPDFLDLSKVSGKA